MRVIEMSTREPTSSAIEVQRRMAESIQDQLECLTGAARMEEGVTHMLAGFNAAELEKIEEFIYSFGVEASSCE